MKRILLCALLGASTLFVGAQDQKIQVTKNQFSNGKQIQTKPSFKKGKTLTAQQEFVAGIKTQKLNGVHGDQNGDPRNLPLSENGKLLSVDGLEVDFRVPDNTNVSSVCYTPRPYVNGQPKSAGCPFTVPCDDPSNRDNAVITTKYFQLVWHVMQSTAGGASSNIDQTRIDALMTELNADYAAHSMIFCADPANFYVDDVNYTHDETTEEVSLKTTYNVTPTQVINIYVVGSMGPGGYARFPYDPMGGTSATGGIVLNKGNCNVGTHTLAHEMGHVFGLEHTFSGVDERSQCSSCYEQVRNANGSSNTSGTGTPNGGPYLDEGDREGDWCSDTNPHDTNPYNCTTSSNPNGACDIAAWNNAPVNNHMSYSFCSSQFTQQQFRRMHCMVNTYLGSWTAYGGGTCGSQPPVADFSGTPLYGVAPLTVNFTDLSQPSSIITQWDWNFDVTAIGGVTPATFSTTTPGTNPPAVTYTLPGTYTVELVIQSANGNDTETKTAYVQVITPPNTCDTLYTQWETPTPTVAIYSFGAGDYFTGTPSTTLQTTVTDAIEFTERFPSAGAGTTVGGVKVGLGFLKDTDQDMTFDIFVWDDNAGQPDWLPTPSAGGLLGGVSGLDPTALGVPGAGSYVELWIPFANEVAIPGTFFHVGVNMNPGDVTDTLVLVSSTDLQGETDNSNHVWSSNFGTISYELNTATDFDLDIVPVLGEYTPSTIVLGYLENVVCDTTHITLIDTTYYTDWTNLASVEYQFSDGQTFTFSPPTGAYNIVDVTFTTPGPVSFDVISTSAACGRVDTNSYVLPYNFMSTPNADFTKDLANPICQTAQPVTFTANNAGYSDYTWDFGDGTVTSSGSSGVQTHTYAAPGSYYVTLTATSAGYQPSDTIFLENFEAGIPGTWATFDNDGATPNAGVNPPFTGTDATAWLDMDVNGTGDLEAYSTSWNVPSTTPADDWLISPQVMLNATSSLAWEAEAISASWPDGYEVWVTTGAQTIAGCTSGTMVYSTTGENSFSTTHNVDLAAAGFASQNVRVCFRNNSTDMYLLAIDNVRIGTTGSGCSNTVQKLNYVEIIDCSVAIPVTDGDADVLSGCGPLDVTFTDITAAGDPATSWLWNFDDGTFSTSQNPPVHTFTTPGVYNVTFEACNGGGCAQEIITITVYETPVISGVSPTNPTTCMGTDGSIVITATVGSGTLEYSIDAGATYQPSNTFSSLSANAYSIAVRNGTCVVTSSSTLSDPPAPAYSVASNSPTTCSGTDGSIVLSGLTASTSYIVSYDDDGTTVGPSAMVSNPLGVITIGSLNAGTYNNISVTIIGCTTVDPGSYVLVDPTAPTFTVASNNPTTCSGTNGSIVISGLTPSTIYNVSYDDDGTPVGTSLGSNASGVITIGSLNAGVYTNISVELANCVTTDAGTYNLTDPTAPAYTVTSSNPTSCGGTDGFITLSGLSNSTTYSVSYKDDGVTVGPSSMTSDGSGVITLSSLNAGAYTNISVTITGCTTIDPGTYTLTDPAAPTYTVTSSNPTSCGGTDGFISLSGLSNSTTYSVTYKDDGVTVGPSSMTSDGSGVITISNLNAGSYNNISVSITGCTTLDGGTYSLSDPSAPTFTVTSSDPTTCGGSEGFITLAGLTASTSYNVTYTDGSGTVGPAPISTDGSGNLVIGSLTSGSYSNIIVELAGCSGSNAGPYVLSDPGIPAFTVVATNPTTCGGVDGYLTVSGLLASTSYAVSYDDGAGTNGPTSMTSNGAGEIVISGLGVDTYTNIVIDLGGCITTDAASYTLSNPATSPTFSISVTDATSCGGTEGTMIISGLLASTPYDITYTNGSGTVGPNTLVSDASGVLTVTGLGADSYSNIVVDILGCFSTDPGSYTINEPTAPTFTVSGSVNPTACGLSDGSINITGLSASTTYDVTYDDGGTTVGPVSIVSNPLGNLVISGLNAGSYSNIIVTENGCSTSDAGTYSLSDPSAPTFTVTTSSTTTCGGSDGSMLISGLLASTIYNITYTDGAGTVGPTALGTNASGEITIGSLSADSYSSITVELSGCTTVDNGPYVVSDPAAPAYSVTVNSPTTCGGSDGEIILTGLNAASSYNVSYEDGTGTVGPSLLTTNGAGEIVFSSLSADSYINFSVEANGCTTLDAGPYVMSDPGGPTFNVTSTNPTTCSGVDGTLIISGLDVGTAYNVTYTDGSGTVGPTASTSDGLGTIVITGLGAGTITNVIVELSGCSTTDAGPFLFVDPVAPVAPVAGTDTSYCVSETMVDLTVTGSGGVYNWYDDASLTNLVGTGATFTPLATIGTTVYYVTETSNGCESSSATVTIGIDDATTTANAGADVVVCDTIDLTMDANEILVGTGYWYLVSGTGQFTDASNEITAVTGASLGDNIYAWVATNGLCSSSDTVMVTVNECIDLELLIPTGFTPDGDGVNDAWEIQGISLYPQCIVEIYNKWGSLIFESKGYPESWDGTYNGKELPVGAYYFIVNLNDGSEEVFKGTVTIIK